MSSIPPAPPRNPSKQIEQFCSALGEPYRIAMIDGENVIYRDLGEYDIEVSGLDRKKPKFRCVVYVWKGLTTVKTIENITSFVELKDCLGYVSWIYQQRKSLHLSELCPEDDVSQHSVYREGYYSYPSGLKSADISRRLKLLREEQKLSYKEICYMTGISSKAYTDYENGEREPKYRELLILAEVLHVSLDFLVGRTLKAKVNF